MFEMNKHLSRCAASACPAACRSIAPSVIGI
jgi:hypothetical protein